MSTKQTGIYNKHKYIMIAFSLVKCTYLSWIKFLVGWKTQVAIKQNWREKGRPLVEKLNGG
jgi:hypothetical protein